MTRKFACSVCGKKFFRKYTATRHERNIHRAQSTDQSERTERFQCCECDKDFGRPDHLKRHLIRIHRYSRSMKTPTKTKQNSSTCVVTDEKVASRKNLNRHERSYHETELDEKSHDSREERSPLNGNLRRRRVRFDETSLRKSNNDERYESSEDELERIEEEHELINEGVNHDVSCNRDSYEKKCTQEENFTRESDEKHEQINGKVDSDTSLKRNSREPIFPQEKNFKRHRSACESDLESVAKKSKSDSDSTRKSLQCVVM